MDTEYGFVIEQLKTSKTFNKIKQFPTFFPFLITTNETFKITNIKPYLINNMYAYIFLHSLFIRSDIVPVSFSNSFFYQFVRLPNFQQPSTTFLESTKYFASTKFYCKLAKRQNV